MIFCAEPAPIVYFFGKKVQMERDKTARPHIEDGRRCGYAVRSL